MHSADPSSLFVLACPACGGRAAAAAAMAGRAACCPFCAAAFTVPTPLAAAPGADRTPTPAILPVPPPSRDPTAEAVDDRPRGGPHAAGAATPVPAPPEAPPPTFELPDGLLQPAPAGQPAAGLQFREPVKTIGTGEGVIELRRLTPEERENRRRRRNVIMLLTGTAILITIAMGLWKKPRRS